MVRCVRIGLITVCYIYRINIDVYVQSVKRIFRIKIIIELRDQ